MLTWDENIKPTPPLPHACGSSSNRLNELTLPSGAAHILDDGAVLPSTPATSRPSSPRRINAADKRIINGKTDVNPLVQVKYKWAWEK